MINPNNLYERDLLDYIHEKANRVRDKIEQGFYASLDFALHHPEQAAAIVGAVAFGLRKADKYVDIWRENRLRNSMIYDRSLGMYWQTKRPLTTNQRLVIESRHKAGESYGSILSDMKVLKR